jgi:hypothetical protein
MRVLSPRLSRRRATAALPPRVRTGRCATGASCREKALLVFCGEALLSALVRRRMTAVVPSPLAGGQHDRGTPTQDGPRRMLTPDIPLDVENPLGRQRPPCCHTPAKILADPGGERDATDVGNRQPHEHPGDRACVLGGRDEAFSNDRADAEEGAVAERGHHPGLPHDPATGRLTVAAI